MNTVEETVLKTIMIKKNKKWTTLPQMILKMHIVKNYQTQTLASSARQQITSIRTHSKWQKRHCSSKLITQRGKHTS